MEHCRAGSTICCHPLETKQYGVKKTLCLRLPPTWCVLNNTWKRNVATQCSVNADNSISKFCIHIKWTWTVYHKGCETAKTCSQTMYSKLKAYLSTLLHQVADALAQTAILPGTKCVYFIWLKYKSMQNQTLLLILDHTRGLFKKHLDWNCSGCSLGGMCLQPVLTCSYMS
jgi:hypothetical protein